MDNEKLNEKLLEALLDANRKMAEMGKMQEMILAEQKSNREKSEEHSRDIAVLQSSYKSLGETLDGEKKLNRDRQLDFSKLLDDKMDTIYRMASIIASVISLAISILPNIFK